MIWIVGRGIYALNYIRYLKLKINLITTDKYDFAGYSKYVKKVYYIDFDEKYCSTIEKLVKNDMVIAIGEETLYLDEYIKKNNSKIKLFGYNSSNSVRLQYHNKENLMNLVHKLNLPYLNTWNSGDIIDNVKMDKYILKLTNSRGGIGQKIIEINNKYIVPENYILQPYIQIKKDYSTFVIAKNGIIEHYVCYECIDMINGFSTERKKVNIKDLYYQTNLIVNSLNYTGFLGLDFIEYNSINYMVDFNPRITNGISLLKNELSVSTLPYISKKKSFERIIKSVKYSDIISINDIMPFFYMIIVLIRLIVMSLLNFKQPSLYIREYIEKSVVKYN